MTMAGLNTVNLSEINTFQQIILFLLLLLGSTIAVSIVVVFVRLKAFERRFKTIVEEEKKKQRERGSLRRKMTFRSNSLNKGPTGFDAGNGELRGRPKKGAPPAEDGVNGKDLEMGGKVSPILEEELQEEEPQEKKHRGAPAKREPLIINTNADTHTAHPDKDDNLSALSSAMGRKRAVSFAQHPNTAEGTAKIAPLARILSMQGVGARHDLPNHPIRIARPETFLSPVEEHHERVEKAKLSDWMHHLSIGRNSNFSNLSIADRERLGGVEYRTLELLAIVVPLYFVAWQFLGAIGMGAWVVNNGRNLTEGNGLNPWYAQALLTLG